MEPHWLIVMSWLAIGLGVASASVILADEFLLGHRQHMPVMNLVHPITALYWGPVWLWAYFRSARKSARDLEQQRARRLAREGADPDELRRQGESTAPSDLSRWHIGNAVSHCGAGCTLGDIGGEWMLFALLAAPTLGISGTYGWEVIADFALAWTFGVVFQYFTIVPTRRNVGKLAGIWQAMTADTLSIVSFQVGLFGWMAIAHFVLFKPPLDADAPGYWLMMQIGMILGYFTAWPVNRRLVSSGIKEKMDERTHLAMLVEQFREHGGRPDEAPGSGSDAIAGFANTPESLDRRLTTGHTLDNRPM